MVVKMDAAANRRVHAARLLPTGEKPAKVAELVGAPRQTVYRWLDVLPEGGIEALLAGPIANGYYATDLWTLKRVRLLIEKRATRVRTWAPKGRLHPGRLASTSIPARARMPGRTEWSHSHRIPAALLPRTESSRVPVGVIEASCARELLPCVDFGS
jgi:hypothetical protein